MRTQLVAWAGGFGPTGCPPSNRQSRQCLSSRLDAARGGDTLQRRIAKIGKPLAGKTGTSNDGVDTWFIGFAPDLPVGVFVGFDKPRSLGPSTAPMWRRRSLNLYGRCGRPPGESRFGGRPACAGAHQPRTGQVADANDRAEAFIPGTGPVSESPVIGGGVPATVSEAVAAGASGLLLNRLIRRPTTATPGGAAHALIDKIRFSELTALVAWPEPLGQPG